jgi:nucleoside-diphosphate-sugar epimerase
VNQKKHRINYYDSTILVVGGAGFVGSNIVRQLLAENPQQIIVVDNLLSSEAVNIPSDDRVRFIFGSITDDKILAGLPENLDYAFHLACFHGNQSSIADPLADHDNNTLTSLKLFDRLKDIKSLRKVVYAAAACAVAEKTYDSPTATTEDQPVALYHDSPYSISKIIGELYGNYFFQRHKLPFVKARFSNVYGPREILGAGRWRGTVHTVWRNVIPTFIWKALHGESLCLDNEGNASRDFIYVEDMARGLMACALYGEPGEVYNLATGKETTILNLAKMINDLTGNKAPLELRPARDWDRSGKRFASTEKAREKLGFVIEVPIAEGLAQTVKWTKTNKDLIVGCIKRHEKQLRQAE